LLLGLGRLLLVAAFAAGLFGAGLTTFFADFRASALDLALLAFLRVATIPSLSQVVDAGLSCVKSISAAMHSNVSS
jgi:hypothetical protein